MSATPSAQHHSVEMCRIVNEYGAASLMRNTSLRQAHHCVTYNTEMRCADAREDKKRRHGELTHDWVR